MKEDTEGETDNRFHTLRQKAWDKSIYAFGTAHIFECRSEKYRMYLGILTFLGIGVPVLVGGAVLAFGLENRFLPFILTLAAIVTLGQLVFSVWALVTHWTEQYRYSLEALWSNHHLSSRYAALASDPPKDLIEFRRQCDLLDVENQQRERLDYQQGITEKEKRRGHCAGLRQYDRPCIKCGKIPDSLNASQCSICGQF